jgi:hypothetical protein
MATLKLFRNGCCCFRTLKSTTVAAGMFTLITSMMQSLVALAVFTGVAESFLAASAGSDIFKTPETTDPVLTTSNPEKQRTTGILYVILAGADLIIVFLSLILLFGVEAVNQKKTYFYPWILLFPFYIVYESAINIYYFSLAFDARSKTGKPLDGFKYAVLFKKDSTYNGYLVVPLIYWIMKEIIILIFWLAVIFYTKEIGKKPKPGDGVPTKEADMPLQQPMDYPILRPQLADPQPYLPPAPVEDPYGFNSRIPQTPFYRPVIRRPIINEGYDPGSYDRLPTANVPYGVRAGAYNPAPGGGFGNYFSFNPR